MAKAGRSASALVDELTAQVRAEVLGSFRPALERLASAVAELEIAMLGGKKRGRPAKSAGAAPAAKPAKRGKGRKRGRMVKRGAIKEYVRQALASEGKPVTMAQLRDAMLKIGEYKSRDPKSLYTQLTRTCKEMSDVAKSANGTYSLKAKK